jgi:hypothetical protein
VVLGEVREVLTGIVGRREGQEKRGRVPSESCGREERGTSLVSVIEAPPTSSSSPSVTSSTSRLDFDPAVEQTLAEKAEKVGSWRARPATGSLLSLSACQVRWELRERRGSRGGSLSAAGTTTREREKESTRTVARTWLDLSC